MYCFQFKQIVTNHCSEKYFKLVDREKCFMATSTIAEKGATACCLQLQGML
jgi:hypothetical protein